VDLREVDQIFGWGKETNCPSVQDDESLKRDARGACRLAIDNAEKAIQSSNEQATKAMLCRAEGERVFLEMKSLLPPDFSPLFSDNCMPLAQRGQYVRDAGPQLIDMLEQKAGEVGDWFNGAKDALKLARDAEKAFGEAKCKLLVKLEICGDQQLKSQAFGVTSTNELADNTRKAEEACDFLKEKKEHSKRIAASCRAMSCNVSRPGLAR
jgi:hypothetical protein